MDTFQAGGLIAIIITLIEVIKYLIKMLHEKYTAKDGKRGEKKDKPSTGKVITSEDFHKKIEDINELLLQLDVKNHNNKVSKILEILKELQKYESGLSAEQANQLRDLYNWHNIVDENGNKIWYVPRSWESIFIRTHEALAKVIESQRINTALMESMSNILNDINSRIRRK